MSHTEPSEHSVPRPSRRFTQATLRACTCAVLASVSGALVVAAPASAAFVRPFLRQIAGTCPAPGSCTPEETIPFGAFGPLSGVGLATDGKDHLWVGDTVNSSEASPVQISEFDSGEHENPFIQTRELSSPEPPPHAQHASPESLAINRSNGISYFTGKPIGSATYPPLEFFNSALVFTGSVTGFQGLVAVAVDNSVSGLDPSACGKVPLAVGECFVYVSHDSVGAPSGDAQPLGIAKLDGGGSPVSFSASSAYVEGNEIVGTPPPSAGGCEMFANRFPEGSLGAMTVDSSGDIFVLARCKEGAFSSPVVLEYRASGEFVRKITGGETPGINGHHDEGGFGGHLAGIAFDAASGHFLVSVVQRELNGGIVAGVVDEFDAASGVYVGQITEAASGLLLGSPAQLAVDSQGFLYVAERVQAVVEVFGPGRSLAGLRVAEPSERRSSSVVLNGSVNPAGVALKDCRFQWVTEAAFQENLVSSKEGFSSLGSGGESACVPGAGEVPVDSGWHAVHVVAGSLVSGVTYRYRVVATTEGVLGGVAVSGVFAFTVPHAPRVESVSAGNLSSTFADLHARIDPLGAAASYHFEYDTVPYTPGGAAHGVSVPVPDALIGSGGSNGSTAASVFQSLGGLAPSTTYHFRVVAVNSIEGRLEATRSEDAVFTTTPAPASGLPDGRAYELVTPANKGSAVDTFNHPPVGGEFAAKAFAAPASSGDQFLLEAESAFAPFSASFINAYRFSRTAGGWQYTALASPSLGVQSIDALAFGVGPVFDPATISRVAFPDQVGSLASEGGSRQTVLVGEPGGPYTILHADAPIHEREEDREETVVAGASHDLSHLVLTSKDHTLAPGAGAQDPETHAVYEWAGGGECAGKASGCKLVNVESKGGLLSRCGATLGTASREGNGEAHNAVSSDGSKLFFTAPEPLARRTNGFGCWNLEQNENVPQLYMRVAGKTVLVSSPQPGVKEEGHPPVAQSAAFVGAAEDGSKVYFLSRGELTKSDEGIHDIELYEYDSVSGALTRVSAGQAGNAAANVFSVKAVSADGSSVFFEAFGRLTANAPKVLPEGQVYVYRYGPNTKGEPETSYVGTVFSFEATNGGEERWFGQASPTSEPLPQASPVPHSDWYTTPDGRFLLFGTAQQLTGYSTVAPCPPPPITEVGRQGRCQELYRYDASEPLSEGRSDTPENPVCVSCNPSGAPPVSHARFTRSNFSGASASALRALSDNGFYAFFDSADPLVPQDTNGTLDVYEWEAQGIGGCDQPRGCIRLISNGEDPSPSYFLGASPDGANVFFGTHAKLVAQDTDTAGDVYDARICTEGDPCIKPQAGRTAVCEGDACQTSAPVAPAQTPATLTPSGTGNIAVAPKGTRPTRAQQLAQALRACRNTHQKSKKLRSTCERQAQRRYGTKSKSKAKRAGKAGHGRGK